MVVVLERGWELVFLEEGLELGMLYRLSE